MQSRPICYAGGESAMTAMSKCGLEVAELNGQLPPGEVHVWLARLAFEEDAINQFGSLLDSEEHARAARFAVPSARRQFVASRASLRIVLGKYLGINAAQVKFRSTSHGKPELAGDSAVHFNLSHTEGLAAIAVTRIGAVGIDVERVRDQADILELADRFFSKKEAEWIRSRTAPEHSASFFACWTAKEAYVKARGGGLSIPLDGFAIIPDPGEPELQLEVFADAAEAKRWSLYRLELPEEFKGAVAVEGAVSRVRARWLPAAKL